MRKCYGKKGCGLEKDENQFRVKKNGKDGLDSICVDCDRKRLRENRAKPEARESDRIRKYNDYKNNPEKYREWKKQWQEKNLDYVCKWAANNI